jgi:hypothetical protein
MPKNAEMINCVICDFKCRKQSNFDKHLLTRKHKILTNPNEKNAEIVFECANCKNVYKHASSLSSHKKKCPMTQKPEVAVTNPDQTSSTSLTLMVIELMKSNQALQKQMLDVCQNSGGIHNNTINSHNKTFNLQFFLNEQCKDAMNLMDFVDSFKLQFADLEKVGEIGYIEGISNIIMKKLNEMDVYKRPIHCSDAKREIMYVKDDNVWEKESPTCDKLRKAIKYISKKNSDLIPAWQTKNPLANNFASHVNDQYLQIIKESMGGSGEVIESENKIIKKIAKAVLIEKL